MSQAGKDAGAPGLGPAKAEMDRLQVGNWQWSEPDADGGTDLEIVLADTLGGDGIEEIDHGEVEIEVAAQPEAGVGFHANFIFVKIIELGQVFHFFVDRNQRPEIPF